MRAKGTTVVEIAKALGRSHSSVHWAVDENGAREKSRKGVRRSHGRLTEGERRARLNVHVMTVEVRKVRQPRKIINRDAVVDAARAFARGEIDRAELMRRISV
jgi:hypothetical protein